MLPLVILHLVDTLLIQGLTEECVGDLDRFIAEFILSLILIALIIGELVVVRLRLILVEGLKRAVNAL